MIMSNNTIKILVTGANGQLGRCFHDASKKFPTFNFTFVSRDALNIDNFKEVSAYFSTNNFDYCINTAAYTNVEKAESNPDEAFLSNAEAVKNLSEICKLTQTTLIHISTDYVFDGEKTSPYTEEDKTNPINVYGASKLKGEQYVQEALSNYFIFRTSWLYSQYGHNFLNTIIKYAKQGKPLTITTEQVGTPTNANDLAIAILNILASESKTYGIYNFSNAGEATWYDFAKAIVENKEQLNQTSLAKTNQYRTFAARPKYSILDTNKFKKTFGLEILSWQKSLEKLLNK